MSGQWHLEDSPYDAVAAGERANVNNIKINLGGTTLMVVALLVAIIGACGLVMGLNLSKQAQMDRDFRDMQTQEMLKERRLMDLEGYLIVNGLKRPGDDSFGPTGNLDRMQQRKAR